MAIDISSKSLFPAGPLSDIYLFGKDSPLSASQRTYMTAIRKAGIRGTYVDEIVNLPPEASNKIWEKAWNETIAFAFIQAGKLALPLVRHLDSIRFSPVTFTYDNDRDPFGVGRPSPWEVVISNLQKDTAVHSARLRTLGESYATGKVDLLTVVERRKASGTIPGDDPAPEVPTALLARLVDERARDYLFSVHFAARSALLSAVVTDTYNRANESGEDIGDLAPLNMSETYKLGFYLIDLAASGTARGHLKTVLDSAPTDVASLPLPQEYLSRVSDLTPGLVRGVASTGIGPDSELSPFAVLQYPLVIDKLSFDSITHFGIYYVLKNVFKESNPEKYNVLSPREASQRFLSEVTERKHALFWDSFRQIAEQQKNGTWGPLFAQTLDAAKDQKLVYANPFRHDAWSRQNIATYYETLARDLPTEIASAMHPIHFMLQDAYGTMVVQSKIFDLVRQVNVAKWTSKGTMHYKTIKTMLEGMYGLKGLVDRMPLTREEAEVFRSKFSGPVAKILYGGRDMNPGEVAEFVGRVIYLQLSLAAGRLGNPDRFYRWIVMKQFSALLELDARTSFETKLKRALSLLIMKFPLKIPERRRLAGAAKLIVGAASSVLDDRLSDIASDRPDDQQYMYVEEGLGEGGEGDDEARDEDETEAIFEDDVWGDDEDDEGLAPVKEDNPIRGRPFDFAPPPLPKLYNTDYFANTMRVLLELSPDNQYLLARVNFYANLLH